jgi:hypothetical protein
MAHINLHSLATHHGVALHSLATHHGVALHSLATHHGVAQTGPLIPPFPGFNHISQAAELRIGQAYAATHGGLLPADPFWEYMIYRHDISPAIFDANHRAFAALLDRNQAVTLANDLMCPPPAGLVPNTPYWNYLRYRHDISPAIFDANHPTLARLLDLDQAVRRQEAATMVCPPPSQEQVTPPSPGEITTVGIPTGTFTPGTPIVITPIPPIVTTQTPTPSSVIPLASGLLIVFFARRWGWAWVRLARQRLGTA